MHFIKVVKGELAPTLYREFREIIVHEFLKPEQDPSAILVAIEKMKRLLEGHTRLLGAFDVFLGKDTEKDKPISGKNASHSGKLKYIDTQGKVRGVNGDATPYGVPDSSFHAHESQYRYDGSLVLGDNSEMYGDDNMIRPVTGKKRKKPTKATKQKVSSMSSIMDSYYNHDDNEHSSSSQQMYINRGYDDMNSSTPGIDVMSNHVYTDDSMKALENYHAPDSEDQQHLTQSYINEVRHRLVHSPATMAYFMEILRQYTMQQNTYGVNVAFDRVAKLFTPHYKVKYVYSWFCLHMANMI